MNWVNKHKLPEVKVVKYNSCLCLKIENLWHALQLSLNMTQNHQINIEILDQIPSIASLPWIPSSEEEFISSITKCNNSSTPSPNKLLWRHLKSIVKNKVCLKRIINIADVCFELGHWLSHFKNSMTIIILKSNIKLYNALKSFRPIVLLNILRMLIKKVIGNHLQSYAISNNFIYQSQLGGLKHKSTTDAGIALTYFIHID